MWIIFLMSCTLYNLSNGQELSEDVGYYVYDDIGNYMISDKRVYVYEGYIYIPYTLSAPMIDINGLLSGYKDPDVQYMLGKTETECPIRTILTTYIERAQEYLNNVIPDSDIIKPEYSSYSEVLHRGELAHSTLEANLKVRHRLQITDTNVLNNTLKDVVSLEDRRKLHAITVITRKPKRTKRALPLIIAGVAVLGMIGGGFVWNRIDIEALKTNIDHIDRDIDIIYDQINKQTDNINTLAQNTEWMYYTMTQIEKDMTSMKDYINCHLVINEIVVTKISNWIYLILQSFIRALNSALVGQLNLDLIPGKTLKSLVSSHVSLRSTTYPSQPSMIYKVGRFEIVRINKKIPSITGLIILPNVKRNPIGRIYRSYQCPFFLSNVMVKLNMPEFFVFEYEEADWIQLNYEECVSSPGEILCPPHALAGKRNKCMNSMHYHTASQFVQYCDLQEEKNYINHVITNAIGLIACPTNSTTNLIWITDHGIKKTQSIDLRKRSRLFTAADGTELLYNHDIHPITESLIVNISVSSIDIGSWNIKDLNLSQLNPGWTATQNLTHIHRTMTHHDNHLIAIYVVSTIICLVILSIIGVIIYNNKRYWAGITRVVDHVQPITYDEAYVN